MVRTMLILLLPCSLVTAQTEFSYSNFASKNHLELVRDASLVQSMLRLTAAAPNQRGAAWYAERVPVVQGFETKFAFRITEQANNEFGGADGFAFVIQDRGNKALGDGGANAGFSNKLDPWSVIARGMPASAAIFFDTLRNEETADPSGNYIGVYSNGKHRNLNTPEARMAYTPELPLDLRDGNRHDVRVTYSPGRLAVYVDDVKAPLLVAPINLAAVVGTDGKAYVGFTAGTGGGFQNHDILNWTFAPRVSGAGLTCEPQHYWCTPADPIVQQKEGGVYHVVLPARYEQGASIPNPEGADVTLENAVGSICWDPKLRGGHGCNGTGGSSVTPSRNLGAPEDFLAADEPAGALLHRTEQGRTFFGINDRRGAAFSDNEGYFEFDVRLKARSQPGRPE